MATGYHDFTAGETLTAANLEDFCMKQSVMIFASAAARDSALAAVLQEGMFAYLLDVNGLTIYSGATWSTVGPVHGALTSWTPTITQSGAVTKTVTHGTYQRVGRRITANCLLAVTGAGTAANTVLVSLPVACAVDNMIIGIGYLSDSSANAQYGGIVFSTSGGNCFMLGTNSANSIATMTIGSGSNTFVAALASGDAISMEVNYPAATDA